MASGVFVAAVTGDEDLARERRAALLERAEGRRPRTWLAMADAWTGETAYFNAVTWPQGRDDAYSTWSDVLRTRRTTSGPDEA